MHPGWLVLATSLWGGFACNVALWRELTNGDNGMFQALATGLLVTAVLGGVLSLLGWRKTLKSAATLVLFGAALAATSIWVQALPVDASLFEKRLSTVLLPSWASLLRWQVPALLGVLALVPAAWVWHTPVRRLAGPDQLQANLLGMAAAGVLLVGSGLLLLSVKS